MMKPLCRKDFHLLLQGEDTNNLFIFMQFQYEVI